MRAKERETETGRELERETERGRKLTARRRKKSVDMVYIFKTNKFQVVLTLPWLSLTSD